MITGSEVDTAHEIGRALWLSARNIHESAAELDAMLDELTDLLTSGRHDGIRLESVGSEESEEPNSWIVLSWSRYLVAKLHVPGKKGPKTRRGNVTLCVRLYSTSEEEGEGWAAACVPKLFVGYDTQDSGSFWTAEWFNLDGSGGSEVARPRPPHLWCYQDGEEVHEASWFFCVPLAILTDAEALDKHVAKPLLALIASRSGASVQSAAFPADAAACPAPRQ